MNINPKIGIKGKPIIKNPFLPAKTHPLDCGVGTAGLNLIIPTGFELRYM